MAFAARLISDSDAEEDPRETAAERSRPSSDAMMAKLRAGVIGNLLPLPASPSLFGDSTEVHPLRRLVYCDWTASGRGVSFVENYLARRVLPTYGNTHTSASNTGRQTTCFREESREIIQLACNAHRTKDIVLFCGSGSTAAVNKLVSILEIVPELTTVFVGPWEHHSNLLPWRESGATIVQIQEASDASGLDLAHLEAALKAVPEGHRKIGSFSACSNVTGKLEPRVDDVAALLHRHGALSFWDYATAAPYVEIDMNPVRPGPNMDVVYKDAVFISPHKFVGGAAGAPGLLVAKKKLFQNDVPTRPGGGTVYFVTDHDHRYVSARAQREEGGTPDVMGSIRTGLAFQIKQEVGTDAIARADEAILEAAKLAWSDVPNLEILSGLDTTKNRLPIFAFLVRSLDGRRYLHHNFVARLLNDLFGIQARAGCVCAGPYMQRLLGLTDADVAKLSLRLIDSARPCEDIRPGATRLSLTYFSTKEEIDFVLNAVKLVAASGWRLLPMYAFDANTGEWHLRSDKFTTSRVWLAKAFEDDALAGDDANDAAEVPPSEYYDKVTRSAIEVMANPPIEALRTSLPDMGDDDELRWYTSPFEAQSWLKDASSVRPESTRLLVDTKRYYENLAEAHSRALSITTASFQQVLKRSPTSRRDSKHPLRFPSSTSGSLPSPSSRVPIQKTTLLDDGDVSALEILGEDGGACAVSYPSRKPDEISSETYVPRPLATSSTLFPEVPHSLLSGVMRASKDWGMINDGDKLLLGLSGGKDSLALLHILLAIKRVVPFRFEVACCTVDPGTSSFDPTPLIPYIESLGVTYHFEKTDIFEAARRTLKDGSQSYCAFCARRKRGVLYSVARRHGYTALVLGQHLDDLVESFLMSAFRNGQLRTMKANYVEAKGEVRVIRPLIYVREKETKAFSFSSKLPVINENCPACFEAPSERARAKQWLREEETVVPNLFNSLRKALVPLMDSDALDDLTKIRTRIKTTTHAKRRFETDDDARRALGLGAAAASNASAASAPDASATNSAATKKKANDDDDAIDLW